ncbi:GDP/UDP-N,N'-diacetylbacillosamine 2-epimerase (hydrolysing) [Salegentibacter echinorum]|uniref:GDP/UDP-N,N'-diacetylbacillosamine 2-epimerase (Hydrolysing) n=1 Tax=Salegentibacter echinorum TaxID=1073325 RepID=A0A1M5FHN7_SALEC|nr:UDP-N-acetylglucosamine 2-epimerase [Salegentibacter echinorum]SHF90994.1 GDP/UDP-N,N'-diacetylbacillosamine 2-epimerase (hydrolysing) [Salegentibacter echinorum]
MKKIAIVTGTRAEFGLLSPLMDKIQEDKEMQLQLIVTAMHLSPEFGYTVDEIEEKGYKIDSKVECLLSSDTAVGVTKSVGLATIGFADAFTNLSPDVVVILGDRTEMLAAATSALLANIPIAHIHGGETTEGAYDENIRHAITKMSYLHFASAKIYRQRIIQLGEHPDRVFNVGAIGLDSIKNMDILNKEEFEQSINFKLGRKNILITFHPVTLEDDSAKDQFNAILEALDALEETHFIFTHANSDKSGRVINQMIEQFVNKNRERAVAFKSLGHLRYLSALEHIDMVLGNSSSGIIEVPYFNIPTVNIGDRQKGRILSESIIQSETTVDAITLALQKALDIAFRKRIENQVQLYGSGNTAEKIMDILRNQNINSLKKSFYDIQF